MSNETKRTATCPRCRSQVAVTAKGNLYVHQRDVPLPIGQDTSSYEYEEVARRQTCPGSGMQPAPEGRGIEFMTPDDVAEMLSDERLADMLATAQGASQGRWGAWGMTLLVSEDEAMNVDTATKIGDFYTTDDRGRPRTFDLSHVANMQPMTTIALIEEVQRLRKARRDLAQAIVHTREYVDVDGKLLPPIEGWSWYDALREHAPEFLPRQHEHGVECAFGSPTCPEFARPATGALHDEDPAREARWQAARIGQPVMYDGDKIAYPENWDAAPTDWRDDLAERFREYGWHRMAKFVERD